ncbi:heme A synthase [Vibrio genomosp. F6]|uniref:COX15/CtaA family protein n=1 Tax=Vibrio TaxID=662 RepID=UPI000DE9868A|nr:MULTISPECIES: COX15/CtaA family protein [Vibrio]MDN3697073.1 COX15/CtaA family protein [Vibrio cortegadensis]RBW64585.1 heme A synthase [Vibrionales bacterium C3R12]TKF21731.1 heme A synthase [Vibrio genomosp. F6]
MKLIVLVKFSLILTAVVIMLGAYTRLSDAGLGCPDWPGCYGQIGAPSSESQLLDAKNLYPNEVVDSHKAWLEMIHRYFAGTLGLVIFAIAFLSIRSKEIPPSLPMMLCGVVIFQALLGMWTVTMKLMPIVVMGHLLGGFALFSLLTLLYCRLRKRERLIDHYNVNPALRPIAIVALIVVILQIMLGGWTSSNYAALMCTSLPICEGNWPELLNFDRAFQLYQPGFESYEYGVLDYSARMTIHVTHRIGAMITALVVFTLAFKLASQSDSVLNLAGRRLGLVLALQLALGISNVVLHLPLPIAVAHNIVAALLLVGVVSINYLLWKPHSVVDLSGSISNE